MSASKPARPKKAKDWRQALKPYNTAIIALGLFTDSMVGIFTVFNDSPPFDPVLYGMISATVKAANVAIHYVLKTIQEGDNTDAAA